MTTTLTTSPAQTARAFLDAFAGHDVAAAVALADPQVSVVVHPLGVHRSGREVLQTFLHDLVTAFPDLLLTVQQVIVTGAVSYTHLTLPTNREV